MEVWVVFRLIRVGLVKPSFLDISVYVHIFSAFSYFRRVLFMDIPDYSCTCSLIHTFLSFLTTTLPNTCSFA